MRSWFATVVVAALVACSSGHQVSSNASPPPQASPTVAATALATATAATLTTTPTGSAPSPAGTAPSPAATQTTNLLTLERGSFVRSWSVGASTFAAEALPMGRGWTIDGPFSGTPELVFELPAVAQITRLTVNATLPANQTLKISVAGASANANAFADLGEIALTGGADGTATGALQSPITARWLRFRFDRATGTKPRIDTIVAEGSVAVPAASFSGRWILADSTNGADAVFGDAKGEIPTSGSLAPAYQVGALEHDGTLIAAACTFTRDVWHGPIRDNVATIDGGGSLQVVGDGTMLVGYAGGDAIIGRRTTNAPACDVSPVGHGPVVAIVARYPDRLAKFGPPDVVPGHRYRYVYEPTLTAADLRGATVAVLAMSCSATKDLAPWQQQALLDFVRGGRVLIVSDADLCSQSDYAFIPYPFTTAATGAQGARGSVLSIADSSVLGSSDPSDRAHHVDTAAYLRNTSQQLGDADIMQTNDPHWCGLMYARNAAGSSGWIRAYARLGSGVIVYDGFDADDLRGVPQAVTLMRLAYGLSPGADLPCNARVASALTLMPSIQRSLPYGKAADLRFAFTLARQGAAAPTQVALSLAGENASGWRATADRPEVTLGSSAERVVVSVHVPATASASRHLYTLTATDAGGEKAQASIEFDITEALAKELERGGRARIYGIHFAVASARIESQSESTIREIAGILRSHPGWRMRVEGDTDSDGGAAYNLALSARRARAVVDDLVKRYRVARARLTAVGYGATRPVAPNATDAGKALNRRVELART